MKLKYLSLILILFMILPNKEIVAYADSESEFESEVLENLSDIDFSEVDNLFNELKIKDYDAKSLIKEFIKGNKQANYSNIIEYSTSYFFSGIKEKLPSFAFLFILLILCSVITSLKGGRLSSSTSELVQTVSFSAVVCVILGILYNLIDYSFSTIQTLSKIIEVVFPIILSIIGVVGGGQSFSPAMVFITQSTVEIYKIVVFPIITSLIVFEVLSSFNSSVKIKGFANFFKSILKWILGLICSLYTIILTVNGFMTASYSSISYKAIKYAVSNGVPIVGGFLSGGLDYFITSIVLIENALGGLFVFLIVSFSLKPIIYVLSTQLSIKLMSAVLEPISDKKTFDYINSTMQIVNYLLSCIIIITFMSLILVAVCIFTMQGYLI